MSPAPLRVAGARAESKLIAAHRKSIGLNGIMAVRPPQPPRHKKRPQAAGPPLRESLEALEEPPALAQNSRWAEWVSFSPLRRALHTKPFQPPPEALGQPHAAKHAMRTLGLSPEERAPAQQKLELPNVIPSPARQRRPKPRALDVDLFEEEAEAVPGCASRSDRSTPHRDACLQISSPFPEAEIERFTPGKRQLSSPFPEAEFERFTPGRRLVPITLNFATDSW